MANEGTYTPGPLTAKRDRQNRYMQIVTARGVALADVYGGETDTDPDGLVTPLPDVANATLYAAAPEMLEALRAVLDTVDRKAAHGDPSAASAIPREMVQAAIAKAEGR